MAARLWHARRRAREAEDGERDVECGRGREEEEVGAAEARFRGERRGEEGQEPRGEEHLGSGRVLALGQNIWSAARQRVRKKETYEVLGQLRVDAVEDDAEDAHLEQERLEQRRAAEVRPEAEPVDERDEDPEGFLMAKGGISRCFC